MTIRGFDEFRFLVLNKKSAWDEGVAINLQTSDEGIQLEETFEYVPLSTIQRKDLPPGHITDFALGQCNLLYILDGASHAVWIFDHNQTRYEKIECIEGLLSRPTSIAFLPGTLYVADIQAEQKILALAQINWQIRWTVGPSIETADKRIKLENFTPIALVGEKSGNLYALDASHLTAVKIDRRGHFIDKYDVNSVTDRELAGIAISQEDFLYLFDKKQNKILRISIQTKQVDSSFIDFAQLPFKIEPSGLGVDSLGNLYIGDGRKLPEGEEDDRFIRKFSPAGNYIREVPSYRGSVAKLLVDQEDRIYVFDQEGQKFVILNPEPTFLRAGVTPPPLGRYFSKALDSTTSGTQWHKVVLDAEIPEDTQVRISYFIADDEQSQEAIQALPESAWSPSLVNPRDALIRSPLGRYLWLRVELVGSERFTPRVKSIRVYFPRRSYLRYLPAVYQEDDRSRDFLERFLSLFETLFSNLEGQIDHIVRYFDADVVFGGFLHWLASWLAIAVDQHWSEEQLRALVKRAPDLYKKRGTRQGISDMIELYTDQQPTIVEAFQLECVEDGPTAGHMPFERFMRADRAEIEGVLHFERIVPARVHAGEEFEIKVMMKARRDLRTVSVSEFMLGELKGGQEQPRFIDENMRAGEHREHVYRAKASRLGGTIRGRIQIRIGSIESPIDETGPTSVVAVIEPLRDLLLRLYGHDPYCFCVLLKPCQVKAENERRAVRRIVDLEKPAHTCAGLLLLQPWVYLDMHTYLGINTYLSKPSPRLDTGSALPRDTVLTDIPEAGQMERRSRLGLDTVLT